MYCCNGCLETVHRDERELPVQSRLEHGSALGIKARHVLAISIAFLFLYSSHSRVRCQQTKAVPTERIDIGVMVRQLDGTPMERLGPKDFQLVANGHRLPVSLKSLRKVPKGSARVPRTRVLIIVSTDYLAGGGTKEGLLSELPAHFGQNEIAMVTNNGFATRYALTKQGLVAALRNGAMRATNWQQAIKDLNNYPGRRVLVYMTNRTGRTPESLRQWAATIGALIYQVGGDTDENYVYWGDETTTPSLPAYGESIYGESAPPAGGTAVANNTAIWESFATKSVRDVYVEKSIKEALHDIAQDGYGYYVLRVAIPSTVDSLELGVKTSQDYQLSAQPYSQSGARMPVIVLPGSKEPQ